MHVGDRLCTCHVQNEEVSVLQLLQYLGNYLADCAESWYVGRHPLGNAYPCATVGVLLHVRTCRGRFQISRTAEPIVLKFGTWLGTS